MFRRIFDMENPLMRALSAICDLLVLNLLTAVCCLPVVTSGAAFTALCDQSLHYIRDESTGIIRPYFRSFHDNFKKGTLLGLIFLAAFAVFFVDFQLAAAVFPPLRVAVISAALIVGAIALYAFFLQARYENTILQTLKNAASLSVAFFPKTLGMLVFTVGLWIVCLTFFQYALPVLLMFGFSLPAYIAALLLDGVFQKIEPDNENKEENQ